MQCMCKIFYLNSCSSCKCRRNITEFGRWKRGRLKKTCNFCLEKKKKIWEERKKLMEEYKSSDSDLQMEYAEGEEHTHLTYNNSQYENNSVNNVDNCSLAKTENEVNNFVPLRPNPISNKIKVESNDSITIHKKIVSERQKSIIWLSINRKNKKFIYSPVYRSSINASLIIPLRKINQSVQKQ